MNNVSKKSLVVRILLSVFGLLLIGIVGFGIYAVRVASIAEMNFHAMRQAVIATQMFVQDNDCQWPSSWDDLKSVAPENFDLDWASQNVEFNFAADPNELANQTWETFSGIVPNEPCYKAYEDELEHLINTLAKHEPE